LKAVKEEKERVETENKFLKRDIQEEGEHRSKIARRIGNDPGRDISTDGNVACAAAPIQKKKTLHYRDGFDDDEIRQISPSKPSPRGKPSTPKAGAKRKMRGIDDSPIPALELSQSRRQSNIEELKEQPSVISEALLSNLEKTDVRFDVSKAFLSFFVNVGD
jgi:hypothetical protein